MKTATGSKSIPRYFADAFFLPWCEEALAKKTYDEKEIIDAINFEIKRLDTLKLRGRGRVSSAPSSEMKCVARGCKYTGLNTNNKSAVGVCTKCGSLEHFECSKTKQEDRDEILKGNQKYFCSVCFIQNPSMIALIDAKKFTSHSIPPASILQVTKTTKAIPIAGPIIPVVKFACINCSFATETQEKLEDHEKEVHRYVCETCKTVFTSELEKEAHMIKDHQILHYTCNTCDNSFKTAPELEAHNEKDHSNPVAYPCSVCDKSCKTKEELESHRETKHCTQCPLCDSRFTSNEVFDKHLKDDHAPACTICNRKFDTKTDLDKHIEDHHTSQDTVACRECENRFTSDDSLKEHILEKHTVTEVKCPVCQCVLKSQPEL